MNRYITEHIPDICFQSAALYGSIFENIPPSGRALGFSFSLFLKKASGAYPV
jgi:hypothetical protein